MRVPFRKMHGTGNLILIVDQRAENLPPPGKDKLRELGNEETGPGFDQLMWLAPADDEISVASYRVFNADGSEVGQCGNGVRCVARYLADNDDSDQEFTLQSPAGPIAARVYADGLVAVSMGTPIFEPGQIPFAADSAAGTYVLAVGSEELMISAVSMGNPHAVLQVADVSAACRLEIDRISTSESMSVASVKRLLVVPAPARPSYPASSWVCWTKRSWFVCPVVKSW